jgi:hypothetical protein
MATLSQKTLVKSMKHLTVPLRVRQLILGTLLAITGCCAGLRPVEVAGDSPTDRLEERQPPAQPRLRSR